jgi:thymidine kinase
MSCQVFVGCQASGKTTSNIIEATKWLDVLGGRGLFISSILDNRDEVNIISSNSSGYKGLSKEFDIIKVHCLNNSKEMVNINQYDVISIDEIQFYPDLEDFVKYLLAKNKHVICSGLDSDWMGMDFGEVNKLLKLSTHGFVKLFAKCTWCKEISKTKNFRLINDACRTGKISGSTEQIEVGGKDKYIPLCFEHHQKHLIEIHNITIKAN